MDNEKIAKTAKAAKDVLDATGDIQKINEILADSQKFRQKSNHVFHEIVSKAEYAPYIALARTANNLKPGNILFEEITDYNTRRLIIRVLRQAIQAYIADTAKKTAEETQNGK